VGRYRRPPLISSLLLYGFFLLLSATILYPIVWMVYSAFKPQAAIFANVFALPRHFYFHNFYNVFTSGQLGLFFRNSLFVASVTTLGIVFLSALTAYALTNLPLRHRRLLFVFFLIGLMVPSQALIISGYTLIS
jgi:ABC-type glycerol-3-phosphate transport system permease component